MRYDISWRDIADQALWSAKTFGPGQRLKGVLEHLRRETWEVEADPGDIKEWADLLILVIDGATRSGHDGEDLITAYHEKMAENRLREWPDWRGFSEDEPIEHVRNVEWDVLAEGYVEEYRRLAGGAIITPEEAPDELR